MMTPNKNILLTGAGFTKDFGGYLGTEMWSVIFNQEEISQSPRLRQLMLREFDYERAYSLVNDQNDYSDDEKTAFAIAIRKAYEQMHESVCAGIMKSKEARWFLSSVISRFAGSRGEKGFVFTLNQDLFVETFYPSNELSIPGEHVNSPLFSEVNPVILPTKQKLQERCNHFYNFDTKPIAYVKLHGSHRWRSAAGPKVMVIGGQKSDAIAGEPLLNWYFSLFKEVLHRQDCNLVIIGYGFRDAHINSVIIDGIKKYSLRVFVVSPDQPGGYKWGLSDSKVEDFFKPSAGTDIWNGLHGYYLGTALNLCNREGPGELSPIGKTLFRNLGLPE